MNNKGYIFTVSTFFLLSALLVLALFYSTQSRTPDIAGPKLSALYEDIRDDVFEIIALDLTYANVDNMTLVTINDSYPEGGLGGRIGDYEGYIEKKYTNLVNFELDNRQGSLAAADVSMSFSNKTFTIRPHEYVYEYDTFSKKDVYYYPLKNETNLLGLAVNMSVEQNVTSIESHLSEGNTSFRLYISWLNWTYDNSTMISRNASSWWVLNLPNSTINLSVGGIDIDGVNRSSSLKIVMGEKADCDVMIYSAFPKLPYFYVESGFTITLRDILGNRPMEDKIVDYSQIKDRMWSNAAVGTTYFPLEIDYVPGGGGGHGIDDDEPELLGFCVCEPCYWESYYEGETPCELRPCPEFCGLDENMTTWLI